MAEESWNSFARLNAGERFRAQSAEMGTAVTEAVVDAAGLVLGLRVLDVGCGSGEPSISMALRLQGTGMVTGIDLAAAPLEVARLRARKLELNNVEFRKGDVHALEFASGTFDCVTSRLGVMFFSNLPGALREMHRVLRPGGRLALLAWGAMEQPYFERTIGTMRQLRPELEIPASAQNMFQFGKPGTLRWELEEAGFRGVEEETRQIPWDWHGSPKELWEYFRGVTVPFRPMLDAVEGDVEVEQSVLIALNENYDGRYVRCQAQMVLATAER
jgi:ubiquinone/menaquinone biosynthesis C-methylase UbiE